MENYRCPLCEKTMERNLILFLDHTQHHIIDRIKEEHPEWVEKDGVCKPCAEYYEGQLRGGAQAENIGPLERRKRLVMGIAASLSAVLLALFFVANHSPRGSRVLLALPVFLAALGFLQAGEKTCALLAEWGMKNLDRGSNKIQDPQLVKRLRFQGRLILAKSAFAAAAVTFLFLIFF